MTQDYAAGASASLHSTITAVDKFLEREGAHPTRDLRAHLFDLLGDLAVKWYSRGFKRGHMESKKQSEDGKVPRSIHYDATREFFTGTKRTVELKSKLKRKRGKR